MSDLGDNPAPVKAPKHALTQDDPEFFKFVSIIAGSDAELIAQCDEWR